MEIELIHIFAVLGFLFIWVVGSLWLNYYYLYRRDKKMASKYDPKIGAQKAGRDMVWFSLIPFGIMALSNLIEISPEYVIVWTFLIGGLKALQNYWKTTGKMTTVV